MQEYTPTTAAHGTNLGELRLISLDELDSLEPRLRELFLCNEHEWSFYTTPDEIIFRLRTELDLLWITSSFDAFMIGSAVEWKPGSRSFVISCAAGFEITRYFPLMIEAAKRAATMLSCSRIEVTGRDAWARLLASANFRPLRRVYGLDL